MAAAAVSQVTDLFASKLHLSSGTEKAQSLPSVSSSETPKQPDISYHPDEANYKARTARRLAQDPTLPQRSLPEGFPKKLESPLVWEGKDWTDPAQWEFTLSEAHLKEIDDAVKHFKGLEKPLGYLSPETFPLPTLAPELKKLSEELHNGRGFFVLRTIPVDSYTREENVIIYAGVSSHIASRRGVQDTGDIVLAHIKDLTKTHPAKTIGAPAYTQDKQVFHTDIGDIISLYVLETAKEGGTSRISSSWRVYNELAETRPDLIGTLTEEWTLDGFGANPPYSRRSLLHYHDKRIIIQYARRIFTGFLGLPRSIDIPPITEAQAEALDAVHYIAEKYALGLSFQKGDIQYINNLSIFHGRDGYTDDDEKQRHLLRLWLRNDELAWKLPEQYDAIWKRLYYSTTPDSETFPLDPDILTKSKGGAAYSFSK